MNPVRLQDVAARAGVSPKTVSRVVNREPLVSARTRQKVLEVIEELNYRPNKAAQSLAGHRSFLVGLLYDNPSTAYVTGLQEGLLRACDRSGYGLVIHPCNHRDPDLIDKLRGLITSTRMDGVVLSPPFTESREVQTLLAEQGIPVALISPLDQERAGPLAFTDDVSAARRMMTYLIDLGHRRIGFVRGLQHRSGSEMRFEGYKRALEEIGIDFEPDLVANGEFTFEAAETAAGTLLSLPEPPTAIFASSDYMAAGVLKAAHRHGVAVPDELSVCGFDDNPVARYLTPTLTTMRHPVQELAEHAGELLIRELVPNETRPSLPPVVSELVVRESCAPISEPHRGIR